jgi:hypothetical protein
MNKAEALVLLYIAGIFYPIDEDEPEMRQMINLNDAFFWAYADCEKVEDDDLIEVAQLFVTYGWCGVYYWVMKKRNLLKDEVEFKDINRFINFVKHEEELVKKEPNSDRRAYIIYKYELGG